MSRDCSAYWHGAWVHERRSPLRWRLPHLRLFAIVQGKTFLFLGFVFNMVPRASSGCLRKSRQQLLPSRDYEKKIGSQELEHVHTDKAAIVSEGLSAEPSVSLAAAVASMVDRVSAAKAGSRTVSVLLTPKRSAAQSSLDRRPFCGLPQWSIARRQLSSGRSGLPHQGW